MITQYPFQGDAFEVLCAKPTVSSRSKAQTQGSLTKDATTKNQIANNVTSKVGASSKPMSLGFSSNPYIEKPFEDMNFDEKDDASFQFWEWKPMREIRP